MSILNTSFIPLPPPVQFGNFVSKVHETVSALSDLAPDLVRRGFLEHCEPSANLITQLD